MSSPIKKDLTKRDNQFKEYLSSQKDINFGFVRLRESKFISDNIYETTLDYGFNKNNPNELLSNKNLNKFDPITQLNNSYDKEDKENIINDILIPDFNQNLLNNGIDVHPCSSNEKNRESKEFDSWINS